MLICVSGLCNCTVSCPVDELVCHFLYVTEMEQNQVDGRDWVTVKGVCSDPVVCGQICLGREVGNGVGGACLSMRADRAGRGESPAVVTQALRPNLAGALDVQLGLDLAD